jgi:PadR family transcriptional regulator, regulatory protein AphA
MAHRTSSTPEILLGLLSIEPMSGYDLGRAIRDSVGHFWNESYGQIYPTLKQLADQGFVTASQERRQGRPDRRVYAITPEGRQRLRAWLELPPQPEVPRNELLLKLFFGDQVPPRVLIGHVERMAAEHRAILRFLAGAESASSQTEALQPAARYWRLAARFGQYEIEAHLRWAEETLAELGRLVADENRS